MSILPEILLDFLLKTLYNCKEREGDGKMKTKMIKGYAFVVASAFIFGCMPLMAKFIYAEGVTPMSLVLLRNLLSLPILAALASIRHGSLKIPLRALPQMSVIALMGCSITPILLFYSYQYINSGTATVLHFIYPAVVVIFGMVLLKSRVRAGNIVSLILCVAGILLFYDPNAGFHPLGFALALLSGVSYAAYVLLLSGFRYKEEIKGFTFCFYVAAVCTAVMLVVCLASGNLALPKSLSGWGLCLLFAVTLNVGAVLLFQMGTFLIGGERASILSTVEPITSLFAGVIIFDEKLSVFAVIGAVLVLSASVLIAVLDAKKKEE